MQPKFVHISLEEYFAREASSARKHEYVDGEIFAMSGTSRRHNLLATNLIREASLAAQGRSDCQVFGSDMRLHVDTRNSVYYPDVSATCDPHDRNEGYLTHPCFIVEILSPSTAGIDRREKRASYQSLPSLREYVIVEQDRMRVDVYRRQAGIWLVQVLMQPDDVIESTCLGLRLTLGELYHGVDFPTGVAEPEPPEYAVI